MTTMRSMSVEHVAERVEFGQRDGAVVHAAEQRLGDGLGLFADLLLHEGRPAALLGGRGIPGDLELAGRHRVAGEVGDLDRVGADRDDLVLPDLHGAAGCARRTRRRREPRKFSPSPSPITSGELRRAPTTTPGTSWCMTSSVNAPSRRATTRCMAAVRSPVSRKTSPTMRAATSVSVSLVKVGPGIHQLLLQFGEVLDDAVVDEGELAVVAEVRVRVAVGRAAVGRPAGVADAGVAVGAAAPRRGRRRGCRACPRACGCPGARRRSARRCRRSRSPGTRAASGRPAARRWCCSGRRIPRFHTWGRF